MRYDVIIIGGGAAGLFCAIEAGKRGRKVLVLEHAPKVGAKILISGGGRCNFTNLVARSESFVSENPHFCISALSRFTSEDFISRVRKHGIAFHEKKLGQLFCDHSARDILNLLLKECETSKVLLRVGVETQRVIKTPEGFLLKTTEGELDCTSLVIATGGLSFPKIGASGFGYDIAKHFGLRVVATAPALDGFRCDSEFLKMFRDLTGVSTEVTIVSGGSTVPFRESLLWTHFGLSGPAALQASLYWREGDDVSVDLMPDTNADDWLISKKKEGARMEVKNLLAGIFPKRLSDRLCELWLPGPAPLHQTSDKILGDFGGKLNRWKFKPAETMGYDRAEVTRGGVSTDELSSKTMEARKVPGLYFIGEVVDVTGWLGGYNFQWAWSSGWCAGQHV